MLDDVLNVKVGDKVIYRHCFQGQRTERLVTVEKITPTGRIRIKNFNSCFDKYGRKMGTEQYSALEYLLIPTKEDIKRIEENNAIEYALSLIKKLKKDNLTYDKAVKIIKILNE